MNGHLYRRPVSERTAEIKSRLKAAGITYVQVARLADVTWRMVKFVIDGDRTSAPVMAAINRLAPPRAHAAAPADDRPSDGRPSDA